MNALIWRIALRNVLAHRVKSVIVGLIFGLGALVGVVGNALVDAMDRGMSRSIIESLAGHLQIHAKGGKDPFSIYGDEFAGMPDFGVIPDFAAVQRVIAAVPGVESVIPMGSQVAFGDGGNLLDRKLAALRAAVKAGDAAATADLVAHVRSILALVVDDLEGARGLTTDAEVAARLRDAERARSDAFWADFDAAPLAKLELLENRVAPLLAQPGTLPIWFLGTDLDRFRAHFPRFKVVLGEAVPPLTRGFLFNHGVYEEAVKDRAAWAFDKLTRAAARGKRIADDAELQGHADVLRSQVRSLEQQLGPADQATVAQALGEALGGPAPLRDLLTRLVTVDDDTLPARRDLFYAVVAPRIELYAVQVGDTITLRSFTQAGYARALNLKVYGTYTFEGLEDSTITSQHNLVDLLSFRELFGYVSAESQAEIAKLRDAAGVQDVARGSAEDALFGGDAPLVAEGTAGQVLPDGPLTVQRAAAATFQPAEVNDGMALHGAVLLAKGDPADVAAGKEAVQAALDAAGLPVEVQTWQEASGIVGQLVLMIRLVLVIVVSLLSIVALVIINNSVVMATMDRVREIGTMRAIGAQRAFIKQLFMTESLVLSLVAGTVGALAGGVLVWWIGQVGLPATDEFTTFLYSGPALRPTLTAFHVFGAIGNVAFVGFLATLYPAAVAARIPPVDAMAARG